MERLLFRVYNSKKLSLSLKIISHASSLIVAVSFFAMLIKVYKESWLSALLFAISAAVPFVIVSAMRYFINAPRPYELYSFYEKAPKNKTGRSFPSRHVFSAFLIGTLAYTASIPLMIALLLIGCAISVSRVLLGMHFVRDVLAGAVIGVLAGVIGILILI